MVHSVKKLVYKSSVLILPGLAAGIFYAGTANADVHILVGGNTDCTSQGLLNTKMAQGDLQGRPVPVAYGSCAGDFAPFVGDLSASSAINQGVEATRRAWDENCANTAERCVMEGFSVGAAPVAIVGNDVGADQSGSNTHVITDGNAWGDSGMFGPRPGLIGTVVKAVAPPFVNVPVDVPQVPNSENRNSVNDAWGANSGQNPVGEIVQLSNLGTEHYAPAGPPTSSYVSPDGVENKFYGNPLPTVAVPEQRPEIVVSDTPSFWGEAPCVRADGSNYYTLGDAPCL